MPGAREVRLGDRRAAVRGERLARAARVDVGREAEPEVVDDDRVALDDVDDEDDVAAPRPAPERELHVAKEARAEEPEARQLELGVVDVEHVAGVEGHVAEHDAREGLRVAAHLDALERVLQADRAGRAHDAAGAGRRHGRRAASPTPPWSPEPGSRS